MRFSVYVAVFERTIGAVEMFVQVNAVLVAVVILIRPRQMAVKPGRDVFVKPCAYCTKTLDQFSYSTLSLAGIRMILSNHTSLQSILATSNTIITNVVIYFGYL